VTTLLVLRHAKSSWADAGTPDHERPLNARGLRDAPRMGWHLAEAEPRPDRVLCSTALRARQTLEAVQDALPDPPPVAFEPELYLAPAGRLLARLQRLGPGDETVLLVGHNPGLADLVHALAGDGRAEARGRLAEGLKTATLAVLRFEGPWARLAPGGARLEALVRPKDLRGA
jgi:phosphohistidine phosphatase